MVKVKAFALFAGVMIVLFVAYWAGTLIHASQEAGLRAALYGNCQRLNVARISDNRNNYAQFKLWQATITLLKFQSQQPSKVPVPPQEVTLFTAFVTAMQTTLRSASWTPLSNCEQATDHPRSYVPPASVPFVKQPPPLSAFTIGPNE